jgi:putative transcriptional regulator
MLDPNFRRTVVLIGEHGDDGAMGVVLNRPSPVTVADAVPALAALVPESEFVYVGGPVQPGAVVALAEHDEPGEAAAIAFGDIGFINATVGVEEVGGQLRRVRIFAGYAGWAAGQLESELEAEDWILDPAEPQDVFTDAASELWSTVLRRKGGQFALLARMPLDPSVN